MAMRRRNQTALDISQFATYISNVAQEVSRMVEQSQSLETMDNCHFRLESALLNLQRVQALMDEETFTSLSEGLKVSRLL